MLCFTRFPYASLDDSQFIWSSMLFIIIFLHTSSFDTVICCSFWVCEKTDTNDDNCTFIITPIIFRTIIIIAIIFHGSNIIREMKMFPWTRVLKLISLCFYYVISHSYWKRASKRMENNNFYWNSNHNSFVNRVACNVSIHFWPQRNDQPIVSGCFAIIQSMKNIDSISLFIMHLKWARK